MDKLRAIMAVAVLGSTQAHVALAHDSPDIPLAIRTLMVLCVGGPTTKITVEADTSRGGPLGEIVNTEAGLLITPDRKVVPLNKTVRTSTEERREVTLPDGRKMNGLFKITNEELGGWQKESIAADQVRRVAKCIQSYIDTIVSKLPNYFTSSMIGLPIQDNGDKLSDTSFEFLSNTKIEVAMPTLRNLDKAILTLRLIPPFLLNDLSTALEGDRRTVPSFLGSPVIISAELLYNDADVKQLSSTSQDLRAFPPTEWLWLVEPNRSGEMTAFVKFTITGQGGDAKQDVPFLYQLNFRVQTNLWGSITGFIAGNWQWIAGTLVVPLSIYLFHAFWPKKLRDVPATAPPPTRRTTRKQHR